MICTPEYVYGDTEYGLLDTVICDDCREDVKYSTSSLRALKGMPTHLRVNRGCEDSLLSVFASLRRCIECGPLTKAEIYLGNLNGHLTFLPGLPMRWNLLGGWSLDLHSLEVCHLPFTVITHPTVLAPPLPSTPALHGWTPPSSYPLISGYSPPASPRSQLLRLCQMYEQDPARNGASRNLQA